MKKLLCIMLLSSCLTLSLNAAHTNINLKESDLEDIEYIIVKDIKGKHVKVPKWEAIRDSINFVYAVAKKR